MKKPLSSLFRSRPFAVAALATVLLFSLCAGTALAANWGLFGADQSYVTIEVGGTTTSYSLYDNGVGTFDGADLGTIAEGETLVIAGYDVKTWKDPGNGGDVTGCEYFYVVDDGTPVSMGGDFISPLNGNDQKWGNGAVNAEVASTLAAGTHTLSIYGSVSGGTDPADPIDDGTATAPYTATFTVTAPSAPAVAEIVGGGQYASLADAVAAAQDGDTVALLADVTLDARIEPNPGAGNAITIDLGGFTITREGTSGNGSAFDVKSGEVTITNGAIDCTQDDAAIVADGVYAITVRSGANVTLSDLAVTVDSECGACAYPFAGATLAIESGTYANETTTPYRYKSEWTGMAVNQANVAESLITITGGTFSQVDPALGDDSAAEGAMSFVDESFVTVLENGAYVVHEAVTVTFANEKGDAPAAQKIAKGATASEPDAPEAVTGWTFGGWFAEGASEAFDFATPVSADLTLTAGWTEVPLDEFEIGDNLPEGIERITVADGTVTVRVVVPEGATASLLAASVLSDEDAFEAVECEANGIEEEGSYRYTELAYTLPAGDTMKFFRVKLVR